MSGGLGPDPLRTLLETISRQLEEIEDQLRAMYDDAFVDTADDGHAGYWRAVGIVVGAAALYFGWRAVRGWVSKRDIAEARERVKTKLDSLSEMGEMESMRLQMAMDRLSKLMSTLSNMLKKASETAQAITQNIK